MGVSSDLEADPIRATKLCRTSHARLVAAVKPATDEQIRMSSRLPRWSIAHVLTHVARNADGHSRRLAGALAGKDIPRYPDGPAQREREIDEGATRSVDAIVADLETSQLELESVWERSIAAGWPHAGLLGADDWPTTASPVRRLREIEMHHVDLGLGYQPSEWPEEYVAWELPILLGTVPSRVQRIDDARALLSWLAGRWSIPTDIELDPW